MANFSKTTSNGYVRLVFQVTEASTSIPYNTSEVVYHLWLERASSYAFDLDEESLAEAEINGTRVISKYVSFDLRDREWISLGKGTITIPHNEDGRKIITIRARLTNVATLGDIGWFSGTLNLSTIPRASAISSVTTTELGQLVTIQIEKKVNDFRHKVLWKVNDSGWNELGNWHDTSVQFTVPIDYSNRITNSDTGQIDVCVRTFRGDEQIGYDVFKRGIPIKVPDSIVPTLEDVTITERTARLAEFIPRGHFIKDKSVIRLSAKGAKGSYGSRIVTTELMLDNLIVRAEEGDFPAVKSGTFEASAKVTDSRGRIAIKKITVNVLDYYAPKINGFIANRAGNGTNKTIISTVLANVCPIMIGGINRNPYTLKIQYSEKKTNRWIDAVNYTKETTERISRQIDCGSFYDLTKPYNIRLYIEDKISDFVDSVLVVRSSSVLVALGNGRFSIGGFPELENHFESFLPVAFHKTLNVEEGILSNGKPIQEFMMTNKNGKSIKYNGDLNNLKSAGGYHAFGAQHSPTGVNNYGYVSVITHSADNGYCVQFYIPYNADQLYMRRSDSNRWSEWVRVVTTGVDTEWKQANLQSGWQHRTEYEQVQYSKSVDGIVHFRGIAKGGNTAKETVVFQLPEGFKPKKQVFTFGMNDNFKPVAICIYNTGSVVIKDNADDKWLGFHSISFKI